MPRLGCKGARDVACGARARRSARRSATCGKSAAAHREGRRRAWRSGERPTRAARACPVAPPRRPRDATSATAVPPRSGHASLTKQLKRPIQAASASSARPGTARARPT
eukprot:4487294-Pleurochrysis_carterae.AAC.1